MSLTGISLFSNNGFNKLYNKCDPGSFFNGDKFECFTCVTLLQRPSFYTWTTEIWMFYWRSSFNALMNDINTNARKWICILSRYFLVLTHEMQETHELSFGPQQRNVCLTGSLRLIGVYIYGITDSHTK